jgi:ribosomal protein S18 acetylase RimI-like enzyme
MQIRPFESRDEEHVVALWTSCGLTRPWNDPHRDIARKSATQPKLFLVGTLDDRVVATAMVGYEGHRGWVYYLAVSTEHRRQNLGRAMMDEAERLLAALGCPKINLQLRSTNAEAIGFYRALGYLQDDVISLGKRLIEDRG